MFIIYKGKGYAIRDEDVVVVHDGRVNVVRWRAREKFPCFCDLIEVLLMNDYIAMRGSFGDTGNCFYGIVTGVPWLWKKRR